MTEATRTALSEIDAVFRSAGWHEPRETPAEQVRREILAEVSEVLAVATLPMPRLEELRTAVHRLKDSVLAGSSH